MRWLAVIWLVLAFLLSAGCARGQVQRDADVDRYEAIGPDHERYIRADEKLADDDARGDRLDTLRAWEFDLRKQGAKVKHKVRDDNGK